MRLFIWKSVIDTGRGALYSLETIKKYYRVDRREICFLRFIFEAYDGMATMTTADSEKGHVVFHIAPGCEADVEMILNDLKADIMIESGFPEKQPVKVKRQI